MGRKVFISVLGAGFYSECKYVKEDFLSENVRFIQEATLQFVVNESWDKNSKAFFLTTQLARKQNWATLENERFNPVTKNNETYESLDSRLKKLKLGFECTPIDIPDGKNEQELWQIFDILYHLINEDDELYLELTHSFRYLPMMLLVFGNYVKFLKKAKVVLLSYGNYEARNPETNIAPIIDLLPISALQDWTFAAANYLENGNVKKLVTLSNEKLTPILSETKGKDLDASNLRAFIKHLETVVEERRTCRGISIVKSENFRNLKLYSDRIENSFIEPLNPVINKIKESLSDFDEHENVENGFAAARWCFYFGMYQQAATILQENIVTWFCLRHKIRTDNEEEREIINKAFIIKNENLEEKSWIIDPELKEKLFDVLDDELFQDKVMLSTFSNLTEVRNDFNHAGMRSKRAPLQPQSIIKNIGKCLKKTEEIFANREIKISKPEKSSNIFINLSNHPHSTWSERQLQAAREQFGDIVDIAFPDVDPTLDEEGIEQLVGEYLAKIVVVAADKNATPVVHLMGEYTFTFALANKLKAEGIEVVVSTSERQTEMNTDGSKTIRFDFIRFRKY